MRREMFALGSAIFEIMEWKVPYGSDTEVPEEDVITALEAGKWLQLSSDNPTKAIVRGLWGYLYESSGEVVDDLQRLLHHSGKLLRQVV